MLRHSITYLLRAAIRLICSDDTVADDSEETLSESESKHTRAPSYNQSDLDLQVSECDVFEAIRSLMAGSSGGPDGLTPHHLRDKIGHKQTSTVFLLSVTAFINVLLSGRCPSAVQPSLLGKDLKFFHCDRLCSAPACS